MIHLVGRIFGAVLIVLAALTLMIPDAPGPAGADGPAPCSVGGPPDPLHGFCATYSGRNTFYGNYGPGFPSPTGWGFCADNAATGGYYPDPSYGYSPSGPPTGASTADVATLGFALSQATALGWWSTGVGAATPDDLAASAKLLYDADVWGQAVPAMDPGVAAGYSQLTTWASRVHGITAAPTLAISVVTGSTTIQTSAFIDVRLTAPGLATGVAGIPITLTVTNGWFNSPYGPTTATIPTGIGGSFIVPLFATPNTRSVQLSATGQIGTPGMAFLAPASAGPQIIASPPAPTPLHATLALNVVVPTGTVSILKAVDDGAYDGPSGAVFKVESGAHVVATLVTASNGKTPDSRPLPSGTYTVVESKPPKGYTAAPPQTVHIAAGANTVVPFTGAFENHVIRSPLSINKKDGTTGAPLDGAAFDVRFDAKNNGTFGTDEGTCTTAGPTGNCTLTLMPGRTKVTETSAPPGYAMSGTPQILTLTPGEHASVTFDDYQGSLVIEKTGDDTNYVSVVGAVFTVDGPLPSTSSAGTVKITSPTGISAPLSHLVPGSYRIVETTPPPGYSAVPPQIVTVPGSPTPIVVDVLDHVAPATLQIVKHDAESGASLAGAVFSVAFRPTPGSTATVSLGTCTTSASGTCAPSGNDNGVGLYPGTYTLTEITPPPGYVLPTTATQTISLSPGQQGVITFNDQPLVPVTFQKQARGNINPTTLDLAGATIDVAAPPGTTPLTSCTTDSTGSCTTSSILVGGTQYCWSEVASPPGLASGSHGCFTAGHTTPSINVEDTGTFVAVVVHKVDAAAPTHGIAGAVLSLYRMFTTASAMGPPPPSPPPGIPNLPNGTWVASATTDTAGNASFPLQFPGFAYCVIETSAPANFLLTSSAHCTAILDGVTSTPPTTGTVTIDDSRAIVHLAAHKFNSLVPNSGIPGATYDLYVEGPLPAGALPTVPHNPPPLPIAGDSWFARGSTDGGGNLNFAIPAGFAWCLREVAAPVDYVLDSALHCSTIISTDSLPSVSTLALPEVPATLHLGAHKFNVSQPNVEIPGATYELLVQGSDPMGYPPPANPGDPVPHGDSFWGVQRSDQNGQLSFAVPAGHAWCLHELDAPSGYEPDPAFHCTEILRTDSPIALMSVALPEVPTPALAFTGGPGLGIVVVGSSLLLIGLVLLTFSTRRPPRRGRCRPSHRRTRGMPGIGVVRQSSSPWDLPNLRSP